MHVTKLTILFLVQVFLLISHLAAKEIIVNPGDNLNAIIKTADGGDVILVNPGTYNAIRLENVRFTKSSPLIIKNNGHEPAIIQSTGPSGSKAALLEKCSYIAFDGIHFRNGFEGCHMTTCDHLIFTNCEFYDIGQTAAKVELRSAFVDFLHCEFYNTGLYKSGYGEGIYIGRGAGHTASTWPDLTEHVWIENCQFYKCGNGEGINVKGNTFFTTIKNCTVYDIELGVDYQHNEAGISLDHRAELNGQKYKPDLWRENWVQGNTVYNMRSGKEYCGDGIYVAGTGNYIINNTVYDCERDGIQLSSWGGDDLKAYVFNNNCYNNGNKNKNYGNHAILKDPGKNPNSPQAWYASETKVERLQQTPSGFQLYQNYPNPFNSKTTITFELSQAERVHVAVYSLSGQLVRTLTNNVWAPGFHTLTWKAQDAASGVYLYTFTIGTHSQIRKMMLIK